MRLKHTAGIFTHIYRNNLWGDKESVSGSGSSIQQTIPLVEKLPSLFKKYNISSVLDAPCGDFNWMKRVDLSGMSYVGVDIVQELIDQNNRLYHGDHVSFARMDILKDPLPKADVIMCRDALVHFPLKEIAACVENFKRSNSTYLLTTSFPEVRENKNIRMGDWRPINLEERPFSFPKPLHQLQELHDGKTLSLWRLRDL
ncbi:class I SAM-dependent methyltransferase [Pontibacillus salicampi]|uniref:Class I SAM-dependent methyltransferase n=1 Tax=Pontibacillus salicampi TaxID=1449801 RepID=A0ABV6LSW4_9BACI